ncbi:MAG: DUF4340 domain-containing protein [Clostridia bacterium]|nr:DUF4340 domain-containing protein [Clostridia bacterium]
MKTYKNIIALLAVLAILVGTYYFTKRSPDEQQSKQTDENEIFITEQEQISHIEIKRDDISLTFKNQGQDWSVDADVELDQNKVNSTAASFASIHAVSVVQDQVDDLQEFGLDPATAVITIRLKDHEIKKFYIGDTIPSGDGYYFKEEDSNSIYIVDKYFASNALVTLDDMRDRQLFFAEEGQINYIKIKGDEGKIIELKSQEQKDEQLASKGLGSWKMINPYQRDGDVQKISELASIVSNIQVKEFVSCENDLQQYGITDDAKQIMLGTDDSEQLHLLIGDNKDEDSVFVKSADKDLVCTIDSDILEVFDYKPFDLMDKFAFIINIDLVDKVEIKQKSETHVLSIEGSESEEQDKKTYKIDGKPVKEDKFKDFYQILIGLTVDAVNEDDTTEQPEVETIYRLNEEGEKRQVTVSYIPQDRYFYAVSIDGYSDFIIDREKVDHMLKELNDLL